MEIAHYTAAVIGAGPAGASCAISLAKGGVSSVALVDSAVFPRDKSCGDGVGPGAVQVAKRLGLGEKLQQHFPVKYLSVSGPSGMRIGGSLPLVGGSMPVGYAIPRKIFDNYIFERAVAEGSINVSGHQVDSARFEDDR